MISPLELEEHNQGPTPTELFEAFSASGAESVIPLMPFGRSKGNPINTLSTISLLTFYEKRYFNDYPDCKEWVEENLL